MRPRAGRRSLAVLLASWWRSPGARACRTARRCRCCARSAATRPRRRPARSTAATRSTSSATSSPRPGSSTDKHAAARAFLAPEAAKWDDTTGVTVLDGQIDTVPAPGAPDSSTGATTIRIRGTQIGRLTQAGAFEPAQSPFQWDVDVVRRDGQWRISRLPDGVVVPLSIFRDDFRTVRAWFVDPTRQLAVGDVRYVPSVPAKAQAARVIDQLLAGPSSGLAGAAVSELQPGRPAAVERRGEPGRGRRRRPDPHRRPRRHRPTAARRAGRAVARRGQRRAGAAARRRRAAGGRPARAGAATTSPPRSPTSSPAPTCPRWSSRAGGWRSCPGRSRRRRCRGRSATGRSTRSRRRRRWTGKHLAVVARTAEGRTLLVGGSSGGAGLAPVGLNAPTMTRPSWMPTGAEVWTVLGGNTVARVTVDPAGQQPPRIGRVNAEALTALGPISDLRLSRDGMRVVAVVDGGLYTGAVARSIDGEVAIRDVRRLRSSDITQAVAADWRSSETIVAITGGPDATGRADLGRRPHARPGARQQPHPAADRRRRGPQPAAAGHRPGRRVELRGRRPGRVAAGARRRLERGARSTPAEPPASPRVYEPLATRPCRDCATRRGGRGWRGSSGARVDVRELGAALVDLVLPAECGGCTAPPASGPGARAVPSGSAPRRGSTLPGGPPVLTAGRYTGPLRTALLRYKERGRRDLAVPLARAPPPRAGRGAAGPGRHRLARARARPARRPRGPAVATTSPGSRRALAAEPTRTSGSRGRSRSPAAPAIRWVSTPRSAPPTSPGASASAHAALPPSGSRVVLLDDVVTTGATLRACRATLADVGVTADAAVALCDATSGRDDHEHPAAS